MTDPHPLSQLPPGVLATPPQSAWSLTRRDPSSPLASTVAWLWSVTWDLVDHGPHRQAVLPHPSGHLVVEHGDARLHGPTTERFERILAGQDRVVAVRFRIGGLRPLITQPMSSLVDTTAQAHTVLPALSPDVAERVSATTDTEEAMRLLESELAAAMPVSAFDADPLVDEAETLVQLIIEDRSVNSVADLAAKTSRTRRSLQRLFADYVGLGPKAVIQRYRLQEAASIALSGTDVDWASVAADLGYYDQAHLVRHFSSVIGEPPGRYRAAQTDAASDQR